MIVVSGSLGATGRCGPVPPHRPDAGGDLPGYPLGLLFGAGVRFGLGTKPGSEERGWRAARS